VRILVANRILTGYTGTEIVTRDPALAFKALGHQPVVYSPWLAGPAGEIEAAGIPVLRDVRLAAEAPDIVHGNHPKPLLDALFQFPGVPAVAVCHDATSPRDEPVYHPRILRYVAVDERCRARLERESAIPRGRILVRWNAVDLARFARRPALPAVPARALVFSNNASWRTHLPAVRQACQRASIPLDVVGAGARAQTARPESVLGRYDLVFAKARCALEALATGAAVVLCDAGGLGPMVTSANVEHLRRFNFGQGVLTRPHTVDGILAELRRYDASDAARACTWIRSEAGLERSAREWVGLYGEVVEEARRGPADALEPAEFERLRRRYRREARIERQESWWHALARVPLAGSPLAGIARRLARSSR
jgi:hypothetical protein